MMMYSKSNTQQRNYKITSNQYELVRIKSNESQKGKVFSEEHKKNLSISRKKSLAEGRWKQSPEGLENIRKCSSKNGIGNNNAGKKICIDGVIYNSKREACRILKISPYNLDIKIGKIIKNNPKYKFSLIKNGKVYDVYNINRFCIDNDLKKTCLYRLKHGQFKQYKGFTLI